jgi:hypothetical protein
MGWRRTALVASCVLALAAGCAGRRDATNGGAIPRDAAVPTNGAVQRDAQGRAYRVRTIPKRQAVRVDADHVRTNWGITLDVVGEDENSWHYKLYEVTETKPVLPAAPSAADRRKVAASYATDVRGSSRLSFAPFGAGLPTQGQWRDGFALADVNGDGALDLVHGPPRAGQPIPRIFLGDGKGNWRLWREVQFPPLPYDYGDAEAADLDGDGRVDLVLSAHLRGFAALRGDGRGGFTDMGRGLELVKSGSGAPPPFSSRAFELVDWNGDGRLDILALGEGPRLELRRGGDKRATAGAAMGIGLFLNDGTKGWHRADTTDPTDGIFGQAIAAGDFDADGRRDFATASGILGRTDLVRLGTGDGGWRRVTVPAIRPAYVRAVTAADFDADGRDDVAVGYLSWELETWRTGVDVLLSRPGDAFERRVLAAAEDKIGVYALAAGDLDGDRHRDLVALTGDGETIVFLGDGRGGFTRERKPPPAWPGICRGVHVALRDLDGDGRDEIVAAFAEERSDATGIERCPNGGGLTAWRVVTR